MAKTKSEKIALINILRALILLAETMKESDSFIPPRCASDRLDYEEKYSFPLIRWKDGEDIFTAEYITLCSAIGIYSRGIYTKNGEKTTLEEIRESLKHLET